MLSIVFCISCLQRCEAATFAEKKKEILDDIVERIEDIKKGIKKARKGTGYFHNQMCQVGTPLATWTTKIEQFNHDYASTPEKTLLEIDAWLNDMTVEKIKVYYKITP
jgi:hypothetical protein